MSHFSVAIITKGKPTEDDIARILEPYDENMEVVHYVTKDALIKEKRAEIENYKSTTYAEYLKDPVKYAADCQNERHLEYLKNGFPKKLAWTDEECYQDAIKYDDEDAIQGDGSVRRTYNPKAQWDWYEIGGRFAGMLHVPANTEAGRGRKSWIHGDSDPYESEYEGVVAVDSARIKDLVFPEVEKDRRETRRFWELYIDEHPPITNEDRKLIEHVWFRREYYLETYKDIETYVECRSQFTTYAAITKDGKWHQQGQMGWWGMSSGDDEVGWARGYKSLVFDNAEEDDYITIVDCHI